MVKPHATLDMRHKAQLNMFERQRNEIPEKQELLEKKLTELEDLCEKREKKTLSMTGYQTITQLTEDITRLEEEINRVERNRNEYRYLLEAGPIVNKYFEQTQKRASLNKIPKKDLKFFFEKETRKTPPTSNRGMFNRGDINDEYLSIVDKDYIQQNLDLPETDYCYGCQQYMALDRAEAKLICYNCGSFKTETLDSDKPSYSTDQPHDMNYFYKRINHFNEILNQFQAKENTEIPQEIYDLIIREMAKERNYNLANLKHKTVKNYFKKYRDRDFSKYYEHIPLIINRLNGIPPQKFSQVQEERLRALFRKIQAPFEKYCPDTRTNFLSYKFILYKMCELLGYDSFLPCFELLKARSKLYIQEQIWKQICDELEWEFIPTM